MSLDVFDTAAIDQNVMQNAAPDLPAGFGETFDIWTRAISEWQGFANYNTARERALAGFYDDVKARTGVQLPLYGMGGAVSLDELNAAIAKLPPPDGTDAGYQPLSEEMIDNMALARMRRAHDDAEALQRRETTWGGTAGTVAGVLAAGLSDPLNVATLPLGGARNLSIPLRALEFGTIAGGTELVNALSSLPARERAVPGSSKEIAGDVGAAFVVGGALGGAFGTLEAWLRSGAKALPTTVRDEVNAASSELQLQVTNPFPGVAAEAAHRDAIVDATMALIRGEQIRGGFDGRLPATIERLSELQLGEISGELTKIEQRAVKARALLDQQDTAVLAREVKGVDRADVLARMRGEIADITAERAGVDARINGLLDPDTAARLHAIEADLNAPGLSRAKAAELEQERATITETLAASSDRDGYAIASLRQEGAALDKLLSRRTSEANKLQAVHEKSAAATAGRRAAIEADRANIETTLRSQSDVLTNEMRRSISKLAAEGYGVRLDRAEAQELAELALADRSGSSLSHITETLVSKARAAREAEAGEAGEKFLRPLTFGEKPDVERFAPRPGPSPAEAGVTATSAIARDLSPAQLDTLAADAKTVDAAVHDLDHVLRANPDAEFTTQVRQADGSYQFKTQKLSDVLKEADEFDKAGKELEACLIGMEAAE